VFLTPSGGWQRPGSPIGKKGPRKANPKYKRRSGEPWTPQEIKELKQLAKGNTHLFAMTNGLSGSDATSISCGRAVQSARRRSAEARCFLRRTQMTQRMAYDAATPAGTRS